MGRGENRSKYKKEMPASYDMEKEKNKEEKNITILGKTQTKVHKM